MGFIPYFLFWGTLAASVPIALHFFYRSRYRVVSWAAMEFLLTSIQQTSRRLKFQELLLLALRVALLLLLALTLALTLVRATSSWGGGAGVDVVLIFDVSGSMAAREGTRTRLEQAQEAGLAILDALPSSSTVQIITCSDRARLLGPAAPTSLDQARALIKELEITHLTTDFLAGFQEASAALKRVHNPNREIYLLSDMQARGWTEQATALQTQCKALQTETTRLFLIRCGSRLPSNAALVGIRPHSDILHRGDRAAISVLVRNTGDRALKSVNVSLEVDGHSRGKDSRTVTEILPGETRSVMLGVELPQAGYQVLRAEIESDEMDSDNRREQIVRVHDRARILIVDGSAGDSREDETSSFFLAEALQPVESRLRDRYPIQVRTVPPRAAFPVLLDDSDLCILADVPLQPKLSNPGGHLSEQMITRLSSFVKEGKSLLIIGGPHMNPDAWNGAFHTTHDLLPMQLGKVLTAPRGKAFHADPQSIGRGSALAPLRQEPYAGLLGTTDVHSLLEVREEPDRGSQTLLKLTDGKPLLASRPVGRGLVMLCTTGVGTEWNDWAFWGHFYLPLWRSVINQLLQNTAEDHNRQAGQPLVWSPPESEGFRSFILTPPGKDEVRLGQPRWEEGKHRLMVNDTSRAGIYRITPEHGGGREEGRITSLDSNRQEEIVGQVFAVAADTRESEGLEARTDQQIDDQLEGTLIHLHAEQDNLGEEVARQRRQEWTLLLVLVLVLTLAETGLAWLCNRSW